MVKLITCEVCGGSIASDAKACPHCGHPKYTHIINKRVTVRQILNGVKSFITGAFRFKGDKCPTFAQFVIQSATTILLYVVLTVVVWLIGGGAEAYLPSPVNLIIMVPFFFLATGMSFFTFRLIFVSFPTITKYERYVQENGLEDDSVYKQFTSRKNRCQLLYWGFFICLFLIWLLIVHIVNDGNWSWITKGG